MTLLIKGGTVYCGSTMSALNKDILIRGKKIVRIGKFSKNSADRVIDAKGLAVVPGFIDSDSDIDCYTPILSPDIQEKFIERGVTTIIGGKRGVSLAPFASGLLFDYLRPQESFFPNIGWDSFKSFLRVLKRKQFILNFGMMIGYSNLINPFLINHKRDLTLREIAGIKKVLIEALRSGAFGLSFDLSDSYHNNISHREIFELSSVVANEKKTIAVSLDDTRDFNKDINFIIEAARKTRARFTIDIRTPSIFKDFNKDGEFVVGRSFKDVDVSIGFPMSNFSALPIHFFMPPRFKRLPVSEMRSIIFSKHFYDEILEHLKSLPLNKITILYMPNNFSFLNGKTIKELGTIFDMPISRAFLELMRISGLKAVCAYEASHGKWISHLMNVPSSVVTSGGVLPIINGKMLKKNMVGTNALEKTAESLGCSFESLIKRMTHVPAKRYGIHNRGVLERGCYADLLLLKSDGVSGVIVNGKSVFSDGKMADIFPGAILKNI